MKPIPDTTCAAIRDGSQPTWPAGSTSVKPYLEISMNSVVPTPTRAWVRRPALFCRTSRSTPMTLDSTNDNISSENWVHP